MTAADTASLTGYEDGLVYLGCEWSIRRQDACVFCAGAECGLCLRGYDLEPCEHDSFARHFQMPAAYRAIP